MTSDDVVREFYVDIIERALKDVDRVMDDSHVAISAICACFPYGEYDWKDSSEGFEMWVDRQFTCNHACRVLMEHYKRIIDAEDYFRCVHDAVERAKESPATHGATDA